MPRNLKPITPNITMARFITIAKTGRRKLKCEIFIRYFAKDYFFSDDILILFPGFI